LNELLSNGIIRLYLGDSAGLIVGGVIAAALIGYLLGSLDFAIIISRLMYKDDIRNHGSGNAGMSNMLRTFGKRAAALTLAGDIVKTLIAVFIGTLILGRIENFFILPDGTASNLWVNGASSTSTGLPGDYIGGVAAVLGHVFPVFYKFKGGKGVVCMLALALFTSPLVTLLLLLLFVGLVWATRFISLGSVISVAAYPIVLERTSANPDLHILLALAASAFVVWMHRDNIKRMLEGTERKVSFNRKKKKEPAA